MPDRNPASPAVLRVMANALEAAARDPAQTNAERLRLMAGQAKKAARRIERAALVARHAGDRNES